MKRRSWKWVIMAGAACCGGVLAWSEERASHPEPTPFPSLSIRLGVVWDPKSPPLRLATVTPSSAVAEGGWQAGDLVLSLERIKVSDPWAFENLVGQYFPGSRLVVEVERVEDGRPQRHQLFLVVPPRPESGPPPKIHPFPRPSVAVVAMPEILGEKEEMRGDIFFVDDQPYSGRRRYYLRNGALHEEVEYRQGRREGKRKIWFPNGQVMIESFVVGETDSHTHWHDNGKMSQISQYRNGKFDGLWKFWDKSGRLQCEIEWREGRTIGPCQRWDEEGRLTVEYLDVTQDTPVNATLANGFFAVNGVPYTGKRVVYFPNGRQEAEYQYLSGLRHGPWTTWWGTGIVSGQGAYHAGALTGPREQWYGTGQKAEESTWQNGQPHGRWRSWSKDGRLEEEKVVEKGVFLTNDPKVFLEQEMGLVVAEVGVQIKVKTVRPGSSAHEAGLLPNDVLQSLEGRLVRSEKELLERLQQLAPGSRIKFEVGRGARQLTAYLRIPTR